MARQGLTGDSGGIDPDQVKQEVAEEMETLQATVEHDEPESVDPSEPAEADKPAPEATPES